jgi:hypothetical protein
LKSPVICGILWFAITRKIPERRAFQVKKSCRKNIQGRKAKIEQRLERRNYAEQAAPMLKGGNVHYEMSGRSAGVSFGGVAAIHEMVLRLGLPELINGTVKLLQAHLPYFESDHILNIAYNVLAGGTRLEDLERLRNDEAYMDQIGAERIPDPTTAGDFLRRFSADYIISLMEVINDVRAKVWQERAAVDPAFFDEAIIEVDGTVSATLGECKGGMDISYKGIWGYAPLVVTLANTREVLYIINRPGNTPSSQDAAQWINRALGLVSKYFKKITVRGDTDFSLTKYLDGWDEQAEFVLGYDACPNLVAAAESLGGRAWTALERPAKYTVKTRERARPVNVKEEIVRERGYTNQRLLSEDVAEFDYQPGACRKCYRMVVVRKNISVEKGEITFLPIVRYFFYITNNERLHKPDVVFSANDRCDQENIIAQLKSGINALHAPADDLHSNWAYMVIAALAWTFKAWYGLLIPDEKISHEVIRMEYKKFLHNFIALPCQIVKSARRIVVRVIGYTQYLASFFATYDVIRRLRET